MSGNEVVVRVAGAAGDGVQSAGLIMARVFSRSGLHVGTYNYYQSIIRGGQSWYQIRASSEKVRSQGDGLDILVALNKDAIERHTNPKINEGGASPLSGIVIYDKSIGGFKEEKVAYTPMPLTEIASKYGKSSLMKNTVALGGAVAAVGVDFETLADVIREQFENKGDIAEENVRAAKEGYDYFLANFKKLDIQLKTSKKKHYLMAGGEAVAIGAVNAGLKMYFGYPMTPATSVLHFLASHSRKFDVFVKITEDEISAINMAIGANYAGVRSMTGSSGGGFALMTEAVGMSGMMEVPLVIYEAQRAGPSTGLPTKTEQGDLGQILGASQGDFHRIVLTPRNVEDCFYLTREALNLAEKYQTPVFILVDLFLAEHYETLEGIDLNFEINRGLKAADNTPDYKRYKYTETGISERAFPGQSGLMHNEDTDEHNEYGDVVSDAVTDPGLRMKSLEKRMRKIEQYMKEIPPTPTYRFDDAEYAVIQWGSTQGAVEEAVDNLRKSGIKIGAIELNRVYPLNRDINELIKGKKKIVVVENNYSGQLYKLLRSEFLMEADLITKYDGESFYPGVLTERIESVLKR